MTIHILPMKEEKTLKTVVGLFDTYTDAQRAVTSLEASGIPSSDISLIASNASETYGRNPADTAPSTTDSMTGAALTDAGVGAAIGGTLGLLAGASLFVIPGLGWLAGAGWLAGMLQGAAVGALAGGLIGVLTHIGVPETDANTYNEGVRRGGTLVAVKAPDQLAQGVADILGDSGAVDIDERAASWRQTGDMTPATVSTAATAAPVMDRTTETMRTPAPAAPVPRTNVTDAQTTVARGGEAVIPVVEEDIQVGKRAVERGGVRVYTHVEATPVEQQVTLREEHVTVDRRPVDRPVSQSDLQAFKDQSIEVTERAEEAVVAKQARVVEEVVIGKEATEHTETIRDTVRRTDVEVEPIAGGTHTSRSAPNFDTYASNFRTNWKSTYGTLGGAYEDYEPAYRYGYDLTSYPRYQGQNWNAIETDVRRDWETRYPNSWDRFKNSIRYAWETAVPGNNVPGIQTGGRAMDGTPDTRGITEKMADAVTGDRVDDKTGKVV